jgi:hypothetical protein
MTDFEMEAQQALSAKGDIERQLASAAVCPPWRHVAFAALMAALVAAPALEMPLRMAALILILVAVALIVRSDRKRLGMFINGYRRGRTLYVTLPMLAINLALYAASFHFAREIGEAWPSLALAAIAFAVSLIGSILWQRVFRSELGA